MSDRLEGIEWQGKLRSPIIAQCGVESCRFKWPIGYMPLDLLIAAELMQKAQCPMCGDKKPTVG